MTSSFLSLKCAMARLTCDYVEVEMLDKMVEVVNAIIVGNFNLNLLVHNSDDHVLNVYQIRF